jgi:type I restriction enzyme S subunit
MAKYQKYAEYKDSAIKEIGVIPKHWDISKVKFLAKCLDGQRIPLNGTERGERSGTVPYWGANKIVDYVNDWIFDEELVLLGEDGAPFFDTTKDVAFAINGKIWPNNHVHVLRPNRLKVGIKYLTYSLNCTDYSLYISGSTRDKLNQSDMDNILIRMPSLIEQSQIANFLDHETAQIDTLISKQEKLIELLKEKRQAVISHAVTKGLNPDVAMKDSGVEWLGQVPEHWEIPKLLHITTRIGDGLHSTPVYQEGTGYYFINGNNLVDGEIIIGETAKEVPESEFIKHQVTLDKTTVLLEVVPHV